MQAPGLEELDGGHLLRALLIDPDPHARSDILLALGEAFPRLAAVEVGCSEELDRALAAGHFDFAIMDYQFPWANGLELLPRLKVRHPDCPVVMFTAMDSAEIAVAGLKDGLEDYVPKSPQHFGRLVAAVQTAMGRKRDRLHQDLERRRRVEEVQQAQRLEAIGRLAGGVAHDFNNLLTAINGYSELLLGAIGDTNPMRESLMEIQKAGCRAASLTRELLAFSRRQILQPKVVDLQVLIRGMEPLMSRALGNGVALHTAFDPALGKVKVDPGQLENVIMNLVCNARDAMPLGGRTLIQVGNLEVMGDETLVSETFRDTNPMEDLKPGSYVVLSIEDNGLGMDGATLERIFEPFFTTKPMGKGSGMGLAIVYGIIKQSGGYVFVDSAANEGTRFRICLPRHQSETPSFPKTSHSAHPSSC